MGSRFASSLALGLAVVAAAAVSPGRPAPTFSPLHELIPGERYALEITGERTVVDLPFDDASKYVVVLGSLAPFGPPREVVLTAEACDVARPLRARRISANAASLADFADRRVEDDGSSVIRRDVSGDSHDAERRATLGRTLSTRRTFHLHVTEGDLSDPRQYARVVGAEIARGRGVRVLLDEKHPTSAVTRSLAEEVVRLCDDDVVPAIEAAIGPVSDVDRDGRLTILLTPWLGALQGGRTSLGGFVRAADFDASVASPLSNRGDILYLNATQTPGPHLRTLLLHELTHAACVSARLPTQARPTGLPHEEDWISEGTAHLMEIAHGGGWSNLDYRIAEYLDDPSRYPLVVPDYYRAGLWRSHGCRGADFLFLQWCAGRVGPGFARRLAHSPEVGVRSVERIMGQPFDELFREWSLALLNLDGESRIDLLRARNGDDTAATVESIDLNGRLGRHELRGPRIEAWNVDVESQRRLSIASTSAAYFEIDASASGARRVQIDTPADCRLQATLIRVPAPSPPNQATRIARR